ncbi:MAG TPA: S-adenosylmethionine:tRNA ribosyltransferase-isomerase [Polyangiaceae bacterium]|nr:S-adenosylmethionine:tRNA ribosyltransferase-isomerase [Polyangiaceae bacterium]
MRPARWGSGNPTLTVLHAVCSAFQVSLEEIVAEARANARLYPKGTLPLRNRGRVQVSSLLPDKIPGMQIERLELPMGSRMIGVPHTPGTREYLTCESGEIELVASGQAFAARGSTGDELLDARLPVAERYEISEENALRLRSAQARGGRIIAVGTSVTRARSCLRVG